MAKRAKKVQLKFDGNDGWYYSLADCCKVLGKARSTIMRLLPSWEKVTECKPRKDHSGRWFIPAESVHALKDDPELYLKLAGRSTTWEDERKLLEGENKKLKAILKTNLSKSVLRRLKLQLPELLGDIGDI